MIALIGIVLLMGIVKKNAIMMIDFALEAERTSGMSPREVDRAGGAAALPPDHDDDAGRAVRRAAAGARKRHRLGAAQSARHHHHRRPAAQPVAHALHDAGDLSLHGAACARGCTPARRRGRARRSRRSSGHELLLARSSGGRSAPRCWRSACSWSAPSPTRFLPVASLPTVDLPTISVSASRPGADPEHHGGDGRRAARAAARRDRRRHRAHLGVARSARRASPCSSICPATSTAPRATCRRRSTPR